MARITFTSMYDSTMRNLQHNANKLVKLDEQVASGRRINRPSDDAVGFSNALGYRNGINSLGQQQINMNNGQIYMTALETTHNSMNTIFTRCQELAVQASNDTETHQNRLFTMGEIRQELEQLVALAQSKHNGEYMFSGKWTNQMPYEIKSGEALYDPTYASPPAIGATINIYDSAYLDPNINGDPARNPNGETDAQRIIPGTFELAGLQEKGHTQNLDDEPDYEIDYENGTITLLSQAAVDAFDTTNPAFTGTPTATFSYIYKNSIDMSGEILREVDSGITMKINTNADNLFGKGTPGETDSFKEILSLMQGLWYNDQPKINESIGTVDEARKRNLAQQTIEGARLNRIEMVYNRNADLTINTTDALSKTESIDLADALSQYALADAVYSASLQVSARVLKQSLMDYL